MLHNEERSTVVFANVVQRANVWVGELGDRSGFPVEPCAELWVGGKLGRQNLDRNGAVQPRITRRTGCQG